MSRFNIFGQIHKSLRVLLYDTATLIGRTDFEDQEQYEVTASRVREVTAAFDNHAHHEDTMVLPMIEKYEPSVVDAFEQEHVEDHALSRKLNDSLVALDLAVSPQAKQELGISLMHSFNDFMVFNLKHMYKEETVLNNILWKYYNDGELLETNQKIVAVIPPSEMAFSSQWMMKALSNGEIINWLRNVERSAPEFVYSTLFTTAERELETVRFRKILEGLSEAVMIA